MGLKIAFEEDAELIIFSTGASERSGKKEGEYTRDWALAHVETLAPLTGWELLPEALEQFINEDTELDLESQNTTQECERNFRLCTERGIERVILVSSPWHIQRCHTEALKVSERMRANGETAHAFNFKVPFPPSARAGCQEANTTRAMHRAGPTRSSSRRIAGICPRPSGICSGVGSSRFRKRGSLPLNLSLLSCSKNTARSSFVGASPCDSPFFLC